MGGGLMQLVAYGAQDVYLTGNPQITFFKVVYRRHTNFAMEHVEQVIHGIPQWGTLLNSTISRTGDLLYKINLEWICPTISGGSEKQFILPHNFGHYMIDYVSLTIGGQEIDKQYGHWMEVYSRLTQPNPSKGLGHYSKDMINRMDTFPINSNYNNVASANNNKYNKEYDGLIPPKLSPGINLDDMKSDYIAQNTSFQQMSGASGCCGKLVQGSENLPQRLQIPLPFWFCRNPGLALPLIALQYHDVKLTIKLNDNHTSYAYVKKNSGDNPDDPVSQILPASPEQVHKNAIDTLSTDLFDSLSLKLWVEYIYLDTEERRRFAQVSHEYLIEQVQRDQKTVLNTNDEQQLHLNKFNHPVKSLIFTGDWGKNVDLSNMFPDTRNSIPYQMPWWEPDYTTLGQKTDRRGLELDSDVIDELKTKSTQNTGNASGLFQRYTIPGWLPGVGNNETTLSLSFNGHERFNADKPWYYFSRYQTNCHFSGPCNLYSYNSATIGGEGHFQAGGRANSLDPSDPLNETCDSIGVYSFALKPEEHQPSGTCNFSRMDNCKLTIKNIRLNPSIDDITKVINKYNQKSGSLVVDGSKYVHENQTYFESGDLTLKANSEGDSISSVPSKWMDSSIEWFPSGSKGPNRTWPAFRHDLYDDDGNSWPTQLGGKSNLPSTSSMIVYAINYNVLRIMSGMAGLAYSN